MYIHIYMCENGKWLQLNWRTNKMNSEVLQCCGIEQDFISELVNVYLQLKINAMKLLLFLMLFNGEDNVDFIQLH